MTVLLFLYTGKGKADRDADQMLQLMQRAEDRSIVAEERNSAALEQIATETTVLVALMQRMVDYIDKPNNQ